MRKNLLFKTYKVLLIINGNEGSEIKRLTHYSRVKKNC